MNPRNNPEVMFTTEELSFSVVMDNDIPRQPTPPQEQNETEIQHLLSLDRKKEE